MDTKSGLIGALQNYEFDNVGIILRRNPELLGDYDVVRQLGGTYEHLVATGDESAHALYLLVSRFSEWDSALCHLDAVRDLRQCVFGGL